MSHFTRVQTVIRDQAVLEETLRQLHYRFQAGERVTIRGYQGSEGCRPGVQKAERTNRRG